MVRGLLLPERSVLEGQSGTKAESEAHQNIAIISMDLQHRFVTQQVNKFVVNQLLRYNFGVAYNNKVRLVASPLSNEKIDWLRGLYQSILTNPQGFASEFPNLDVDSLKDMLGVPKSKEIAYEENPVMNEIYEEAERARTSN
jgi:hypothetical protein